MSLFSPAPPEGPHMEFRPSRNNRDMAFSSIIMMCYTHCPFKQSEFMRAYYFRCVFKREHGNLMAKSCHNLLLFFFLFFHTDSPLSHILSSCTKACNFWVPNHLNFTKHLHSQLSTVRVYLGQGESWLQKCFCVFLMHQKWKFCLCRSCLEDRPHARVLTATGLVWRMFAL